MDLKNVVLFTALPRLDIIERAKLFAKWAHQGQMDKSGEDYWQFHLADVARKATQMGLPSTSIAAAWLHDVLEDTAVPETVLLNVFGDEVCRLVTLLTKREDMTNEDYFAWIRHDPQARLIKTCDILSNLDDYRLSQLAAKTRERLVNKYIKSLGLLYNG